MPLRDLLAERCDAIRAAPDEVPLDVTTGRLVDGVGVTLRGNATSSTRIAHAYLGVPDGPPLARLDALLTLAGAEPARAAFGLGVAAGANNWADTSLRSLAHPGAAVLPALLAAAAGRAVRWHELATAVAAGYEAMEVVGRALNDGVPRLSSQRAGFRSAALCGAFGAVGVLTVIGQLPVATSAAAFGIACDLVGGLTRQARGADSAIRMQAGSAVRAGFEAVALARAGVQSAPDVFEAPDGFLRAHHATAGSPTDPRPRWHIRDAAQKFHCAPHNFATALDLVRVVAAGGQQALVEVRVPQEHLDLARSSSAFPDTAAQAALNLRYCCARVLATGDFLWPDDIAAGLRDQATRARFDDVTIRGDEVLSARLEDDREVWPAVVRVTSRDGRVVEHRADHPFGTTFDDRVAEAARSKFDRDAAAGGVREPQRCREELVAAVAGDAAVVDTLTGIIRRESRVAA
ncbi:MmgE/PrpD family protein [Micromonospora sp. WMMD1128]|uniref:MmgE/PrpD family protein n=1 Tax=Micromonospora sp. WMMD1128 TaxID=3015150 RepID=UPI00248C0411|nr:MmgE/PrpD family protein [Micromonospora sp. WMMD1128]WBB72668.1 MmgE/PrpD family protein [Micromonospora sp. WMMD1128]